MSAEFRISLRHGLNCCPGLCFFCNAENGTTVLLGKIGDDDPAPVEGMVVTMRPCEDCATIMATHVLLLGVVSASESKIEMPCRYGRPVAVTDDVVRALIEDPARRRNILRERLAFVEAATYELILLGEE